MAAHNPHRPLPRPTFPKGERVIVIDFRRIPGESTDWVLNHVRTGQDFVVFQKPTAGEPAVGASVGRAVRSPPSR